VLRAAYGSGQQTLDVYRLIAIDVDQFHGIEIEEFPAQIAQVALWLIDHQMNLVVGVEFGQYFVRIPLKATPTRFHVENIPHAEFVVIAKVSSERRRFVPMGFESPSTAASDLLFVLTGTTCYHFGILTSTMHNARVRATCGRLESRYRYSAAIVYNNFPWPDAPTEAQKAAIEAAAQAVLDARTQFPGSTVADLYDPWPCRPPCSRRTTNSTPPSMPPKPPSAPSRPTPSASPSCSSATGNSRRCCLRRSPQRGSAPVHARRQRRQRASLGLCLSEVIELCRNR
jgi:hypothetical protein